MSSLQFLMLYTLSHKAALEDPCSKSNPMPVEDFLVRRVLEEVTGRV